MKKTIFWVSFVLLLIISLVSCRNSNDPSGTGDKKDGITYSIKFSDAIDDELLNEIQKRCLLNLFLLIFFL